MKVLNFYNAKGGTGKTSLTLLTGNYITSLGKKVLLIDLDPQASLSHRLLIEKPERTLYNLLAEKDNLDECIKTINSTLSILPSELRVNKIQNSVLENTFKKLLKSRDFDYVIFDNPPSWNQLVISGISASHYQMIPTLLSLSDFEAANFTLRESKEVNDGLIQKIILNRSAKSGSKEETEYIESFQFDAPIIKFPASGNIKKAIDRNESLELKKHQALKDDLKSFIKNLEVLI
ncbi:MAG: AAA family ATPase [Leptospiraceae bacterium]|nr:AAA family ATPase [Leptospiraceae bacterium]